MPQKKSDAAATIPTSPLAFSVDALQQRREDASPSVVDDFDEEEEVVIAEETISGDGGPLEASPATVRRPNDNRDDAKSSTSAEGMSFPTLLLSTPSASTTKELLTFTPNTVTSDPAVGAQRDNRPKKNASVREEDEAAEEDAEDSSAFVTPKKTKSGLSNVSGSGGGGGRDSYAAVTPSRHKSRLDMIVDRHSDELQQQSICFETVAGELARRREERRLRALEEQQQRRAAAKRLQTAAATSGQQKGRRTATLSKHDDSVNAFLFLRPDPRKRSGSANGATAGGGRDDANADDRSPSYFLDVPDGSSNATDAAAVGGTPQTQASSMNSAGADDDDQQQFDTVAPARGYSFFNAIGKKPLQGKQHSSARRRNISPASGSGGAAAAAAGPSPHPHPRAHYGELGHKKHKKVHHVTIGSRANSSLGLSNRRGGGGGGDGGSRYSTDARRAAAATATVAGSARGSFNNSNSNSKVTNLSRLYEASFAQQQQFQRQRNSTEPFFDVGDDDDDDDNNGSPDGTTDGQSNRRGGGGGTQSVSFAEASPPPKNDDDGDLLGIVPHIIPANGCAYPRREASMRGVNVAANASAGAAGGSASATTFPAETPVRRRSSLLQVIGALSNDSDGGNRSGRGGREAGEDDGDDSSAGTGTDDGADPSPAEEPIVLRPGVAISGLDMTDASYRERVAAFIHTKPIQIILIILLLLDVVLVIVELVLQAHTECVLSIEHEECVEPPPGAFPLLEHAVVNSSGFWPPTGCGVFGEAEVPHGIHKAEVVIMWISRAILMIFLAEILTLIVCLGKHFFTFLYTIDLIIVATSLVLSFIFDNNSKVESETALIVFLRVWRFARVLHGFGVTVHNVEHHDDHHADGGADHHDGHTAEDLSEVNELVDIHHSYMEDIHTKQKEELIEYCRQLEEQLNQQRQGQGQGGAAGALSSGGGAAAAGSPQSAVVSASSVEAIIGVANSPSPRAEPSNTLAPATDAAVPPQPSTSTTTSTSATATASSTGSGGSTSSISSSSTCNQP